MLTALQLSVPLSDTRVETTSDSSRISLCSSLPFVSSYSLSLSQLTWCRQYFVSVPRVLNRIYQSVKASTVDAPGFKGTLTRKAFGDKLYNLKHHGQITHGFWDKIVFKKVSLFPSTHRIVS